MSGWKNIIVRYGGQWDPSLCYIGGYQSNAFVRMDNVIIWEFIEMINQIMLGNSLSTTYQLHYLSRSRSGRIIKLLLSTDDQLFRLAHDAQAEVYVTHDADTSQSEQELYRPSFEIPSSSTYDYTSQNISFDASLTQQFTSSDWFDADTSQYMPQHMDPSRNSVSQHMLQPQPGADTLVEDSDDDDYVEEEEDETESDEEEEDRESALVSYGSFVEFDAWIRREGGFGKLLSTIMQSNTQEHVGGLEPEEVEEMSNWLVPVIPHDASVNLFARPLDSVPDPDELSEGSIFDSKGELKISVGLWHLERRVEFVIPRSDNSRITFKCRYHNQCPFLLRASQQGGFWFVRKFDAIHTCAQNLVNIGVRKVNARVIAAYISRKIREDGEVLKPRSIMADLQREYGVHVTYSVAMRARNRAIEMIYGGHEESFQLLPSYLHMLRMSNPGSMTDLDIGSDGRFRHLFVALGSCRLAYTLCLRPVIVVDGTHLKGRNKGILFVAVTKDGNEQVFPLAYGIGPIENDVSWTWFLSRLQAAYGSNPEMLIVSDAHVSIMNAVKCVYPDATHGLCYYHLLKKITPFGQPSAKLFQKAAYAYQDTHFEKAMAMLKSLVKADGSGAYTKLVEVGVQKWARSQCPVRRYSFMTSNIAESFNSRILWARRLPICSMIEAIRHITEKWFDERHEAAKRYAAELTPEATRKMMVSMELSRRYDVVPSSDSTFKVKHGSKTFRVNLNTQSCACLEWDMDMIPCSHAVAAICHKGHHISNYVGEYYHSAKLAEAYSYRINPVQPQSTWTVPPDVAGITVMPPNRVRQAGRPKVGRYRHPTEVGSSSRSRALRTCSLCGNESHTRRKCPYLSRDE